MDFCSFCLKTHHEVSLIDTTKNSLMIDEKCFEFGSIFNDLFQFTSFEDGCICESCMNHLVQFFMFKRGVKVPQNPFRKMIFAQIDDFIVQNEENVEKIKVIRTFNSISLQLDKDEMDFANIKTDNKSTNDIIDESNDDNGNLIYEESLMANCFSCESCEIIATSETELELHQFLKHTSFGLQLEVELDNSRAIVDEDTEEAFWVCSFCSSHLEDPNTLLTHLLNSHCPDLIFQINDYLDITAHALDFQQINNYLSFIRDCLQFKDTQMIVNENCKQYFFESYKDFENSGFVEDLTEQNVELTEEIEETPTVKQEKREKRALDADASEKELLRVEISRSKCVINSESGEKRVIYKCLFVNSCNHVSNSASGLRYHLMKHIRNQDNVIENRKPLDTSNDGHFSFLTKNGNKNFCSECNIKFKDSRAMHLHEKCHNLFSTVSQYISFSTCNTCNQKFLDETLLESHLLKHDASEDLLEPIQVPPGAIRLQGKALSNAQKCLGETTEREFSWKCGHCEKYFTKEEFCNLHLLLQHTTTFVCPFDRMDFTGFKSVSLFIHHLQNKHNEIFPNLSFACTFCQHEFSTIYEKLTHMKTCDRKQFQCDHCDKRFYKKGELLAHLKIYVTGEVQYNCSICGKKCLSSSDLKIHLRSHTKDKPYKCAQCSKSFRTLAARASHVEGHNANSLYECEICNKSFKQRQLYRRHMKSAHEAKS